MNTQRSRLSWLILSFLATFACLHCARAAVVGAVKGTNELYFNVNPRSANTNYFTIGDTGVVDGSAAVWVWDSTGTVDGSTNTLGSWYSVGSGAWVRNLKGGGDSLWRDFGTFLAPAGATNSFQLYTNGQFSVAGNIIVATNSGYLGSGGLFLRDDGTYGTGGGMSITNDPIYVTNIYVTNITVLSNITVRGRAVFNDYVTINTNLYITTNTYIINNGGTNQAELWEIVGATNLQPVHLDLQPTVQNGWAVGTNSLAINGGPLNDGTSFYSFRITSLGEPDYNRLGVGVYTDLNATNGTQFGGYTTTAFGVWNLGTLDTGGTNSGIHWQVDASVPGSPTSRQEFYFNGATNSFFDPTAADGNPAWQFNVSVSHTSPIVEVQNAGTNILTFGPLAQIGFGEGGTNVLYRNIATSALVYTNGGTSVNFEVHNGSADSIAITAGVGVGTLQTSAAELLLGAASKSLDLNSGSDNFSPSQDGQIKLGTPGKTWQSLALTNTSSIYLGTNILGYSGTDPTWNGSVLTSGTGSSPFTNIAGVVQYAPGQAATNVLNVVSGLVDNATNQAAIINSASPWSSGLASLLSLNNAGTNQAYFTPWGGLINGQAPALYGTPTIADAFVFFSERDVDGEGGKNFELHAVSDSLFTAEGQVKLAVSAIDTNDVSATLTVMGSGQKLDSWNFFAFGDNAISEFSFPNAMSFQPGLPAANTGIAYQLGTVFELTNHLAKIASFDNPKDTEKAGVWYDGSISTGGNTNRWILGAPETNNIVVDTTRFLWVTNNGTAYKVVIAQ